MDENDERLIPSGSLCVAAPAPPNGVALRDPWLPREILSCNLRVSDRNVREHKVVGDIGKNTEVEHSLCVRSVAAPTRSVPLLRGSLPSVGTADATTSCGRTLRFASPRT